MVLVFNVHRRSPRKEESNAKRRSEQNTRGFQSNKKQVRHVLVCHVLGVVHGDKVSTIVVKMDGQVCRGGPGQNTQIDRAFSKNYFIVTEQILKTKK